MQRLRGWITLAAMPHWGHRLCMDARQRAHFAHDAAPASPGSALHCVHASICFSNLIMYACEFRHT